MKRAGFTIVETAFVLAIIVLLVTMVTMAVGKLQEHGNMARETNAARNVISAYLAYAAENNGVGSPGTELEFAL